MLFEKVICIAAPAGRFLNLEDACEWLRTGAVYEARHEWSYDYCEYCNGNKCTVCDKTLAKKVVRVQVSEGLEWDFPAAWFRPAHNTVKSIFSKIQGVA